MLQTLFLRPISNSISSPFSIDVMSRQPFDEEEDDDDDDETLSFFCIIIIIGNIIAIITQ
jgi:hypothetical protein